VQPGVLPLKVATESREVTEGVNRENPYGLQELRAFVRRNADTLRASMKRGGEQGGYR
jgi:hypothetical protein